MGRNKDKNADEPRLFAEQERAFERRFRRQRAIFIPRFLAEDAANERLAGAARDKAFAIAERWAELETSGHLYRHKETSIDTQFLGQLFGEGLGYAVKTTSPEGWQLEHKYSVPGVGIADGAIGEFPTAKVPAVVIELKDATTDLDRDKFNGRTPVKQCWDYLNAMPDCKWGIVSNFVTIRLYHKDRGSQSYEEFTLQELREKKRFNEFYCLFERGGLLKSKLGQRPRAEVLLEKTKQRQKEVGDELYKAYQFRRLELIEHLVAEEGKVLDDAIRIAQKILDRIIFIAFCEDRGLLPPNSLADTKTDIRRYSRAKNPAWENFLDLFTAIDKGAKGKKEITRYNGGLFADDPEINALDLEEEKWTNAFAGFGAFDFSEEVNVEVLGHLFERSITELEKLRVGGLFALKANIAGTNGSAAAPGKVRGRKSKVSKRREPDEEPQTSKMPKSAQRKRFGIYYTPPAFTELIVERTVDAIVRDRFEECAKKLKVDPEAREKQDSKRLMAYWTGCLESLKSITICDPACGSGAFLIQAYGAMLGHYTAVSHGLGGCGYDREELTKLEDTIPDLILTHNLFGVDLSREGVEITQLALWIRSARVGKTLTDLSTHIVQGNSLVSDPKVDPKALDWAKAFPKVFGKGGPGGFDCVIGNPPWERVKVQDREFFSLTDPETAESVNAADRKKRIEAMPTTNAELHANYLAARDKAQKMLDFARGSGRFPLTGKGDVNLYMLFAELAREIVAPNGRVGLLVPSGIATDDTTKEFFNDLMDRRALVSLYDFENRKKVFEDVDGRFKFTALVFGGSEVSVDQADFVFFAHDVEDVAEINRSRHLALTSADMKLLNPNTKTCPIFRTTRDAELTRDIYKRVPILIDDNRKQGGNPWGIKFLRMFDQTNDAEHFQPAGYWKKKGYQPEGNVYVRGKKRALPLYEAKMVQAFDHRAASVVVDRENWVRQGQKEATSSVHHQNPEFAVMPRWWVADEAARKAMPSSHREWLLAYKDVTSATNERTMIASFLPWVAVVNSAPIMIVDEIIGPRREGCLLANLNSFVYDFVARQKVGSVHLNFFIVEQLPTITADMYSAKCPWSKRETLEDWISERVLKLSCTAEDMIPLAKACGFKGSRGDGVHIWKEQERRALKAELDAAYFHLYGISREDAEYMLSTFSGTGYVAPDDRKGGGPAWERGSIGEEVLEAYDALRTG